MAQGKVPLLSRVEVDNGDSYNAVGLGVPLSLQKPHDIVHQYLLPPCTTVDTPGELPGCGHIQGSHEMDLVAMKERLAELLEVSHHLAFNDSVGVVFAGVREWLEDDGVSTHSSRVGKFVKVEHGLPLRVAL